MQESLPGMGRWHRNLLTVAHCYSVPPTPGSALDIGELMAAQQGPHEGRDGRGTNRASLSSKHCDLVLRSPRGHPRQSRQPSRRAKGSSRRQADPQPASGCSGAQAWLHSPRLLADPVLGCLISQEGLALSLPSKGLGLSVYCPPSLLSW